MSTPRVPRLLAVGVGVLSVGVDGARGIGGVGVGVDVGGVGGGVGGVGLFLVA